MNWFDIIPGMTNTLYKFAEVFNKIFFTNFSDFRPQVDNIVGIMSSTIVGAPSALILKGFYAVLESFGSLSNLFLGTGLPLLLILLMVKKLIPLM